MTEQEPLTKLTDIIPIECEVTSTTLTARLAWDKSKNVTIQLIDVPSFPDEICIGLLWQNYAKEIIEYLQGKPRNATPLEAIDLRLHRIEHKLALWQAYAEGALQVIKETTLS